MEREGGWGEREGERDDIFVISCRITCITGEKEGSDISDKVSIYFTHLPDTAIRSAESFTFVVSSLY